MMSAEGAGMAETAGGLMKVTIAFTPEQRAWLQASATRRGRASIAAIVRELLDDAITAERQQDGANDGQAA